MREETHVMKEKYKLVGFVNIRNIRPGFVEPVFSYDGKLCFQLGANDIISGFVEIGEEKNQIIPLWEERDFFSSIGSSYIYAYQRRDKSVYYGNASDMAEYIKTVKTNSNGLKREFGFFLQDKSHVNDEKPHNCLNNEKEVRNLVSYRSKPIFQYKFRPLLQNKKVNDGGFCVILYENRILSFSTYNMAGEFIDELCFSLPVRVIQCFYALLRNASSWLGDTPCDLSGGKKTLYASSLAFDGYDPIRILGVDDLLCKAIGSAAGFFSRHLIVLFEDVANLFAENGIRLTLESFVWDTQKIRPFRIK